MNYDKFSYSSRRNRSEKEPSSYVTAQLPLVGIDPEASVLNPLRHGTYNFSIAEDGVLHSRLVAPPRICYAPIITEVDAPTMPLSVLDRLKKVLRVDSDLALASVNWSDVDAALAALEHEDLELENMFRHQVESGRIATARQRNEDENNNNNNNNHLRTATSDVTMYDASGNPKQKLDLEKVTAVDRAKVELIWKKARISSITTSNHSSRETPNRSVTSSSRYASKATVVRGSGIVQHHHHHRQLQQQQQQQQQQQSVFNHRTHVGGRGRGDFHNDNKNNNDGELGEDTELQAVTSEMVVAREEEEDEEYELLEAARRGGHGRNEGTRNDGNITNPNSNCIEASQSEGIGGDYAAHSAMMIGHRVQRKGFYDPRGRGVIFNEKLNWTSGPKVDSHNYF